MHYYSFIHSLLPLFNWAFICIWLFIHSFIHPHIAMFSPSFVFLILHLFKFLFHCWFVHSFNRSLCHSTNIWWHPVQPLGVRDRLSPHQEALTGLRQICPVLSWDPFSLLCRLNRFSGGHPRSHRQQAGKLSWKPRFSDSINICWLCGCETRAGLDSSPAV